MAIVWHGSDWVQALPLVWLTADSLHCCGARWHHRGSTEPNTPCPATPRGFAGTSQYTHRLYTPGAASSQSPPHKHAGC